MKPKTFNRIGTTAVLAGICITITQAATLQWDADPATAGIQDGGGSWDATATNWINSGNVAWTDGNDAVFGSTAGGPHEVGLAISPTALSVSFNQPEYLLTAASPATLTFTKASGSGPGVNFAVGSTAIVGSGVTLSTAVANQSSMISGSGTLVIGNGGTLRGTGTANTNILSINHSTVRVDTGGSIQTRAFTTGGTALFVNGTLDVSGGSVSIPGTLGLGQSTGTTAGTLRITDGLVTAHSENGIRLGATSGSTQGGTIHLDGGTLSTLRIFRGGAGVAQSILNLNGGTLRKGVDHATSGQVFIDLARVNVRNGGAVIDTNSFTANINSALEHSNIPDDAATDGGLTKNGAGLLVLNGTNTYNGGTTIKAGTLRFGGVPADGIITIEDAGALAAAGGFPTVTSVLASGKLNPSSTGAIALTADSAEDINFGTYTEVMLGASSTAIHTGSLTPASGTYRLGGGGGNLIIANSNALTGSNALVIGNPASSGTVTIANANNFTGPTTIEGGVLQIGDGTTDGSIDSSSGITVNSTLTFRVTGIATPVPVITGPGTVTKTGTGTLVLDHANTHYGTTTVSQGVLIANHSAAFGTSLLTTTSTTAQIQLENNISIASPVRVTDAGLGRDGVLKNTAGNNSLLDFGFASAAGTRVHVVAGSSLSFPNAFNSSTMANFRIMGAGTATLSGDNTGAIGASNSFILGDGTNPGPTVRAGNDLALGAGTIQIAYGSTLQSHDNSARTFTNPLLFSGTSATLGAPSTGNLSFSGATTLGESLELTVNNALSSITGPISSAAGSPRHLSKKGPGTLTIGDAAISGDLTVAEGRLQLGGNVTGTSNVFVLPEATLAGNGSVSSGITVDPLGIVSPGSSTGTLSTSGSAVINGYLDIELDGNDCDRIDVTGDLDITSATLRVSNLAGGATRSSYVIGTFGSLTGSSFASVSGLPAGYTVQYDTSNKHILLVSGANSGFAAWIGSKPVAETSAHADPDRDGLANAVEYVLGSDPSQPTNSGRPIPSTDATSLTFEFTRDDASETPDTKLFVEAGTNLADWPDQFQIGSSTETSSPGVTVTENGSNPDTIRVAIPKNTQAVKFARLKVAVTP